MACVLGMCVHIHVHVIHRSCPSETNIPHGSYDIMVPVLIKGWGYGATS